MLSPLDFPENCVENFSSIDGVGNLPNFQCRNAHSLRSSASVFIIAGKATLIKDSNFFKPNRVGDVSPEFRIGCALEGVWQDNIMLCSTLLPFSEKRSRIGSWGELVR
jgi:hypothetical protein